ncbi:unnamed protein product [Discula destructiva]
MTIKKCLGHLIDIDYWHPSHRKALNLVPRLFMRLGWDRVAYAFLTRSAVNRDEDYSLVWQSLTGTEYENLDASVDPALWTRPRLYNGVSDSTRVYNVGQAVWVMLIKIRILNDLSALLNAILGFQTSLPEEIINLIRGEMTMTSWFVKRQQRMLAGSVGHLAELIKLLKSQIEAIVRAMGKRNQSLWSSLIIPREHDARTNRVVVCMKQNFDKVVQED